MKRKFPPFGTGGIRTLMGKEEAMFNKKTVHSASKALFEVFKKPGITPHFLIGYDNRYFSKTFAKEAAKRLLSCGARVTLTKRACTTPFLSFITSKLHYSGAIMITASHNSYEYNGLKAYDERGVQLLPNMCQKIQDQMERLSMPLEPIDHILENEINYLPSFAKKLYLDAITSLDLLHKGDKSVKVVYSNLHGTGITLAKDLLDRCGFSPILVEEQQELDPLFPTVKSPNPEENSVFTIGLNTLKKTQSDLLLVSDSDADRFGAAIYHQEEPYIFSGNEIATLLLDGILQKKGKEVKRGLILKSIVTTPLLKKMGDLFGCTTLDLLPGFKYIGDTIRREIGINKRTFLFGAEESYGYLIGDYGGEKDGIGALAFLAHLAEEEKKKGSTLLKKLHRIYAKYGIFREKRFSIDLDLQGKENILDRLIIDPPTLLGETLLKIEDYRKGYVTDIMTKTKKALLLPKTEMVIFTFSKSRFIIRPSGTEPKIKVYGMTETKKLPIEEGIHFCDTYLIRQFESLLESIKTLPLASSRDISPANDLQPIGS